MKNQLVVTEGKFDSELMKRVLASSIRQDTKIVQGGGWVSAVSLARSYYLNGNNSIVLLIDADTVDKDQIDERMDYAESS